MGDIFLGRSSWVQAHYRRPAGLYFISDLWGSNMMLISMYFSSVVLRGIEQAPQRAIAPKEYEAILFKV
jgi:hypothetical protein